jgi:hypothetical protein
MCALPNAQWANIKHDKFDPREHIGIGAWSICSAQFTSDTPWAITPNPAECTEAFLDSCASTEMPACLDTTKADYIDFSDMHGINKQYESSWVMARSKCSTAQWKEHCLRLKCLGSRHEEQCTNLTKVEEQYEVTYKTAGYEPALAWSKGETCRPVSDVCSNSGPLKHMGNLGWASFVFIVLGQVCLIAYRVKDKMVKLLSVGTGLFALAWVLLLSSWALMSKELGSDVTCTLVDSVAWGCGGSDACAVTAKGKFQDIADPSYTYGIAIGCWLLLTGVITLTSIHLAECYGAFLQPEVPPQDKPEKVDAPLPPPSVYREV